MEKAMNLKILLYMFELMSGLKVNFQKTEILTIGGDAKIDKGYAEVFNCENGHFPIKYLGLPLTLRKQTPAQVQYLVDQMAYCMLKWKAALMPKSGRLTLV